MRRRSCLVLSAVGALAAVGLCVVPVASASLADETALAERYAPVVRLVEQPEECGPGEPYEPMDVDALFGEPTVALRGPWNGSDLVKIGPTAQDLAGLYEYHLDFPGNPLDPGCGYERWARRITAGDEPAVYAHVVGDPAFPGKLALQYWLFYPFNDWNNTHEGDWEMIQLVFDDADAAHALSDRPVSVGYSQHEGAERAAWGDEKLAVVDGTHPVVYPAAGSHANFYGDALYLGSSASEGVGCDDTLGPHRDLRPVVHTIPSDPAAAQSDFPWIAFEGRWGELRPAFFNGPTGPNLKKQWSEPIRWSEDDWRDRAYAVPAGGALGTQATDFFCGAVARGSNGLRRIADNPGAAILALLVLAALVAWALTRTSWRPVVPLRLARRRAWGQILATAGRMYVSRFRLFVGIGLLFLPISIVVALLQTLVLHGASLLGIANEAEGGSVLVLGFVASGTALTLLGLGLVQAATVRALVEIDAGRKVGVIRSYRLAFDALGRLVGSILIAVVVVSALATAWFLIPVAIWLTIRWALIVPVIELERLSATRALRRSGQLVKQEWLKVASLIVVGAGLALFAGPFLGAALILATDTPPATLNVVAGVVYVVTMPLVALATAYVYFDTRVRDELAPASPPRELPAEIELFPAP